MSPKARTLKELPGTLDGFKIKTLCQKGVNRKATVWEKIFANPLSAKRPAPRIYKEILDNKK